MLAVVGRKILKFLRLHDKLLKAYGYQAGLHHTCCALVRCGGCGACLGCSVRGVMCEVCKV